MSGEVDILNYYRQLNIDILLLQNTISRDCKSLIHRCFVYWYAVAMRDLARLVCINLLVGLNK